LRQLTRTSMQLRAAATRLAVAGAILALAAPAPAAQDARWAPPSGAALSRYETGFEDFDLGSIADQHGWVGINGRFTIETTNPDAGARHFRGTSSGLAWSFARSPFIDGAAPLTLARARVRIGTTTPAAIWEFTPGIANQGGITTVRFNADRSIDVRVASPIPEGVFVPTGASAPVGYFTMEVQVTRATGAFEVLLNGASIATGQGLLVGGVEAVIIYSDMEDGTAGHTFDMDEFVVDGDVASAADPAAGAASVSAAWPSPFGDVARVRVRVGAAGRVRATLHDVLGRRVAVVHDAVLPAGAARTLVVDGTGLAPGVYVLRVEGETFSSARRLVRE